MIPRRLHLIWMGEKPIPRWGTRWREMYAHWDVRLWDEAAVRALPLRNEAVFDWYASRKRWNGAADVARAEIVLTHGGVYVDIDSIPLRPFDGARFMRAGFFAGLVRRCDRLSNAVFGAEAGHPVLETYVRLIGQARAFLPPYQTIGSVLLTRAVGCHAGRDDIAILEPRAFYPVTKGGRVQPGETEPYLEHLWAGSNRRYAT